MPAATIPPSDLAGQSMGSSCCRASTRTRTRARCCRRRCRRAAGLRTRTCSTVRRARASARSRARSRRRCWLTARATRTRSRERVARDCHPDLTWVTPSGAAEMLVADIEEPVVAAATRTPFESARRVFVIEGAETMNDQAANRLLKTLEEPPAFAHLLLLADRREDVLATIASRCQHVRFDPLPSALIARRLRRSAATPRDDAGDGDARPDGEASERALACARLALGDAGVAARLASEEGAALRARAEEFVRCGAGGRRPAGARGWGCWSVAKAAGTAAGERAQERMRARAGAGAEQGAQALRARRRGRAAPRRAARAHATRSTWGCGWPSCGCATCCACARARPSWCTRWTAARSSTQDAAERRAVGAAPRRRAGGGHAPEPGAERVGGAGAGGAGVPPAKDCLRVSAAAVSAQLVRRSARGSARGRTSRTP